MSRRSTTPSSAGGSLASSISLPTRSRKIIVMGVDYDEYDNDYYFWKTCSALMALDHVVTAVRNKGKSRRAGRQIPLPFTSVGTWIPRRIFGLLESLMYILRSVYTALYVCFALRAKSNETEPRVVISDASCIAIPILSCFGSFQVVAYEYFKDVLADFERCNNTLTAWERSTLSWRHFCLSFATKIVLPCAGAWQLMRYGNRHEVGENFILVFYLPAEGEGVHPNEANPVPDRTQHTLRHLHLKKPLTPIRLLVVDVLDRKSNLLHLIAVFAQAVEQMEIAMQQRLSLNIIGYCRTQDQNEYRVALESLIAEVRVDMLSDITLHCNVDFQTRCSLYRSAFAVLNVNITSLYLPSIIEAMYYARLIISIDSEFVCDILQHRVNAIIVDNLDFELFVAQITDSLMHAGPEYRFMAMAAADEYDRSYSSENFIRSVDDLMILLNEPLADQIDQNVS